MSDETKVALAKFFGVSVALAGGPAAEVALAQSWPKHG
jgi:hypothetical protein